MGRAPKSIAQNIKATQIMAYQEKPDPMETTHSSAASTREEIKYETHSNIHVHPRFGMPVNSRTWNAW